MYHFDGQLIQFGAHHGFSPAALEAIQAIFSRPAGLDTLVGRAILGKRVIHEPDYGTDRDIPEHSRRLAEKIGNRSILNVPMIHRGTPIGAIATGRREPGPFTDKQIALLQTFADQAVIAIENVRLFKELEARNSDLSETLEQQTATGEILRVISRSPIDAQPVFDAIASSALRLCDGVASLVFRHDGTLIHLTAVASAEGVDLQPLRHIFPAPPERVTFVRRVVTTAHVLYIGDIYSTQGRLVPFCMFTDPPLARVGMTERDAQRGRLTPRVARLPISAVLRAHTTDEHEGFMKALVGDDDRILGFTMIGADADGVMTVVQTAMLAKLPYSTLRDAILTHPTMAEGLGSQLANVPRRLVPEIRPETALTA